jgi:class 3 adenylate cyclase
MRAVPATHQRPVRSGAGASSAGPGMICRPVDLGNPMRHRTDVGVNPMPEKDFKRELSAIFSADVTGFSRMMGEDEAATVEVITAWHRVIYEEA